MAAAAAAGIDFSKDLAEKQMVEKLAPRLAGRLAVRIGEESAEKWVGRMVPLASSAIGGALNYTFVRSWAVAYSATCAKSTWPNALRMPAVIFRPIPRKSHKP